MLWAFMVFGSLCMVTGLGLGLVFAPHFYEAARA